MTSPNNISDLYAWWRADDLSLSENEEVSSWSDNQSGLTLSQSGTLQPVFKENLTSSGFPAVRFTDSDESRMVTSTGVDLDDPHSIILVHRLLEPRRHTPVRLGSLSNSGYGLEFSGLHRENTSHLVVQSNTGGESVRSFASSEDTSSFEKDIHLWGYTAPTQEERDLTFYSDRDTLETTSKSNSNNILPSSNDVLSIGGTREYVQGPDEHQATGNYSADLFDALIYRRSLRTSEMREIWDYFVDLYEIDIGREPKKVGFLHSWFTPETISETPSDKAEKWESKDEVSNTALVQKNQSKQPDVSPTGKGFEALDFDQSDEMETSLRNVLDLYEGNGEYSVIAFYRAQTSKYQDLIEFDGADKTVTFSREGEQGGEELQIDREGTIHSRSEFVPSIEGTFGMSTFVVSESDQVEFFDSEKEYRTLEYSDDNLLYDGEISIRFGNENVDSELVEVIIYEDIITPPEIEKVWNYQRKEYLAGKGEVEIQADASFGDIDSLVYTFLGDLSASATSSVNSTVEAVSGGTVEINSEATADVEGGSRTERASHLDGTASTFIQSHKNKKFGVTNFQSEGTVSLDGLKEAGGLLNLDSEGQVNSDPGKETACTTKRYNQDPTTTGYAYFNSRKHSTWSPVATASLTAPAPGFVREGEGDISGISLVSTESGRGVGLDITLQGISTLSALSEKIKTNITDLTATSSISPSSTIELTGTTSFNSFSTLSSGPGVNVQGTSSLQSLASIAAKGGKDALSTSLLNSTSTVTAVADKDGTFNRSTFITASGDTTTNPEKFTTYTRSATITASADTTTNPEEIVTKTRSATIEASGFTLTKVEAIARRSATITASGDATTNPEEIAGATIIGLGQGEIQSSGTITESLVDSNGTPNHRSDEIGLAGFMVGQNDFDIPSGDTWIALGQGSFEDGTLSAELPSSEYARGGNVNWNISTTGRNGESVYQVENGDPVSMDVVNQVDFNSVAVVTDSSVGSGIVLAWSEAPDSSFSESFSFAAGDLQFFSGLEDLSGYVNEHVALGMTGSTAGIYASYGFSQITPHFTVFDGDPGQSGSSNEIATSRVDVTSWTNVGQRGGREGFKNDNDISFDVPDNSTVTHIGIYDGNQGSGANQIAAAPLGTNRVSGGNGTVTFQANSILVVAG